MVKGPGADLRRGRRGFTLVEILIVVVILGILAVIVIALFGDSRKETEQAGFVDSLRTFVEAAMIYQAKTGDYPVDGSSGIVPPGFEDYVDEDAWSRPTPIGGVWDTELDSYGVKSALGVHFWGGGAVQDGAYMQEVDALFDDGDLGAGRFRQLDPDRYYYIVAMR